MLLAMEFGMYRLSSTAFSMRSLVSRPTPSLRPLIVRETVVTETLHILAISLIVTFNQAIPLRHEIELMCDFVSSVTFSYFNNFITHAIFFVNLPVKPSNHRLGYLTMVLSLVVIPTQAKQNFHPLGEKGKSRGYRNKQHPQEFQLVNLWFEANPQDNSIYFSEYQDVSAIPCTMSYYRLCKKSNRSKIDIHAV
jgi:hypothetical protein